MQKIVFLGSKPIGYYCLQYILEHAQRLQYQVVAVLSNDNTTFSTQLSIKQLAAQHGIAVLESLEELPSCDIIISVQYHLILKAHHIAKAKRAFNLHMAPLPEYRGCNQFSFAILDEKKEFGTTLHIMDSKIDHGDIVMERRFEIENNCWVQKLLQRTDEESRILFAEVWPLLVKGNYACTPQNKFEPERGTSLHFRNEVAHIKQLQWEWPSEKIKRHIRATYMPGFELPFFMLNNKKIHCSAPQE